MRNFVLMGMPASGKGTQAMRIISGYGDFMLLSMGNLLRNEIKNNTDIGMKIANRIAKGLLASDEIVNALVRNCLKSTCPDFVLYDGYPRTVAQAQYLKDLLLDKYNSRLDVVFYLSVDDRLALIRMSGRMTCKDCGAVFNLNFRPPVVEGVCDVCLSKNLYIRDDDKVEVLQKRIASAKKNDKELLDFYERNGIETTYIDANLDIDAVAEALSKNIDRFC